MQIAVLEAGNPVAVRPGQYAGARVTWKNLKNETWAPTFRFDLRRSGMWSTWQEGEPLEVPPVAPGGTDTFEIYCQVPNWSDPFGRSIPIDAKLCVKSDGDFVPVWGPEEGVFVISGTLADLTGLMVLGMMGMMIGSMMPVITEAMRKK